MFSMHTLSRMVQIYKVHPSAERNISPHIHTHTPFTHTTSSSKTILQHKLPISSFNDHVNLTKMFSGLALAFGAYKVATLAWRHFKSSIMVSFTHSIMVPERHQLASDVKLWLANNSQGDAMRHLRISVMGSQYNHFLQRLEYIIEKHTAVESTLFFLQGSAHVLRDGS